MYLKRFNESGVAVKRSAYGLGETFDKNFKCRDRYHICCRGAFCNKHTKAPCPPPCKCLLFRRIKEFIMFIAKPTPKKEVKACYQCEGAHACRPEKLEGAEIRTSSAFGAKNLYCYTVCKKIQLSQCFICFMFDRNSIQRQVSLSLVVVLDLAKLLTKILNAMLSIIYAAMKICATMIQLVSVLNNMHNKKRH